MTSLCVREAGEQDEHLKKELFGLGQLEAVGEIFLLIVEGALRESGRLAANWSS